MTLAGSALGLPGVRAALAQHEHHGHGANANPKLQKLAKFVDALPRPRRLSGPSIELSATEFSAKLHRDLPPTLLWGYAGAVPGPTIEAVRGTPTRVRWINDLKNPRLLAALPVDETLHWANPLGAAHGGGHAGHGTPQPYAGPVPLVTHLHGAEVASASDGHPDAWHTPGFAQKGPAWAGEWCEYPNAQPANTLWYHDHALGITRLTVYAGLAGMYLLRDPAIEKAFQLPEGDYEREIVIQDRNLDDEGQLAYPREGVEPGEHPFWTPEFFGEAILANGKLWPYLEVEPRRYRLRLVNGSNARFFRLRISDGRPFTQIGADGGYLPAPIKTGSVLLAPGERADLIVDFSGLKPGRSLVLTNNAPAPFPEGVAADPRTTGTVLQFRVVPLNGRDLSTVPSTLVARPDLGASKVTRVLTLGEDAGKNGPLTALLDGKRWSAPVSETPRLGDTEVWEIVNLTGDTHPIHLHLVSFALLNRQRFAVERYKRAMTAAEHRAGARPPLAPYFTSRARPPEANERGLKDTVRANPNEVTRLTVRFAPTGGGAFPFDVAAGPGYVWHCHILEHEDNEMMRPLRIVT